MICLTGGARDARALARRLGRRAAGTLHEVRLDLLARIDDDVLALLARPDVVVTCRGTAEGGGFNGSAAEQHAVLRRALAKQPGYLDVEWSLPPELRRALYTDRGGTKIVLSWHGDAAPEAAGALPPRFAEEPADLLKVVLPVSDAAELGALLDLLRDEPRPVIRIGCGTAGTLSRALYQRFGSPWSYVAAEGEAPTASGQLSAAAAAASRIEQAAELTPLALLGGGAVLGSPGPRVYNALLARRALPFIYVLAPTRRPVECLSLLRRLGGAGCSVTMPAKQAVIPALDELVPGAARTGAVNTVTWHEDRAVGYNTDLAAVRALAGDAMGRRALVLGAGGAARAAAAALQDAGARVAVSGRSDGRAGALARELSCGHVSWAERERARFDLLVNATPCGADGASLPLRPASGWRGATVIDAVLGGRPTPLVREARAGGARTRDGIAWWCEQGARQMELLTGAAWCPDEIEEVARA